MKGFACVLVFAFVTVCVSADEEWQKFKSECLTETGLTEDPFQKGMKPDLEDSKVKCLFACIMKKKGSLVDSKIDSDKALAHLAQWKPNLDESVKNKIKECVTAANEKTEDCEIAGAFSKCTMAQLPHEKSE